MINFISLKIHAETRLNLGGTLDEYCKMFGAMDGRAGRTTPRRPQSPVCARRISNGINMSDSVFP